jgi:hypothetical protein
LDVRITSDTCLLEFAVVLVLDTMLS